MPLTGDDQTNEEKRARILEAAFEVCRERGAGAARMEEVAARAQVSKGTLYQFFESKEDLLLASIIANYDAGLSLVDEHARSAVDPREALHRLFDGLTKLLEEEAPTMVVFYQSWAVVAGNEDSRKRLDEFTRAFHVDRHQEAAQLIRRGQVAGVFRSDVSAEVIGQSIDALLNGYLYWATFDPESGTPRAFRAALDTLVGGVLAVDAPPSVVDSKEPKS